MSPPEASALVDWNLAERVADAAAGKGPAAMAGDLDVSAAGERSREAVIAYTGLEPIEPVPRAEWISRRDWSRMNLASMRELIAPLEARARETLPLGGAGEALAAASGKALAMQVGGLVGLASRRVLGQYELSLLGPKRPTRLVFVGQNLDAATDQLGARPAGLLEWVAQHEMTHAVHFAAAPWLRDHLGGLTHSLLETSALDLSTADLASAARELATTDPRRTLEMLRRSDPVTLLAPPGARATIDSVQATMAAIEGYAEHVMDAAVSGLGPELQKLRAGLDRRRENRSTLARLLSWLLGFEMKLRQYREGKRFCDAVVTAEGIGGLNLAWDGPGALPTLPDLADPRGWIDRVAQATSA